MAGARARVPAGGAKEPLTRQRTAWRCHSLPLACRSRLKARAETCKRKNGSTKESDIGQTREQVWPSDGETETAGRAVEVRKRQRHGAGHRELKAANSWGG